MMQMTNLQQVFIDGFCLGALTATLSFVMVQYVTIGVLRRKRLFKEAEAVLSRTLRR
jgi:hypothetical protein